MNWVRPRRVNEIAFADDPVPAWKWREWCERELVPARKFGKEWRIDLDAFLADCEPEGVVTDDFDFDAAAVALFGEHRKSG